MDGWREFKIKSSEGGRREDANIWEGKRRNASLSIWNKSEQKRKSMRKTSVCASHLLPLVTTQNIDPLGHVLSQQGEWTYKVLKADCSVPGGGTEQVSKLQYLCWCSEARKLPHIGMSDATYLQYYSWLKLRLSLFSCAFCTQLTCYFVF